MYQNEFCIRPHLGLRHHGVQLQLIRQIKINTSTSSGQKIFSFERAKLIGHPYVCQLSTHVFDLANKENVFKWLSPCEETRGDEGGASENFAIPYLRFRWLPPYIYKRRYWANIFQPSTLSFPQRFSVGNITWVYKENTSPWHSNGFHIICKHSNRPTPHHTTHTLFSRGLLQHNLSF